EHDGPRHGVLGDLRDEALRRRRGLTSTHRMVTPAEARELAEVSADRVDREELAGLGGIGTPRIRRGAEERAPPIRAQGPPRRIDTVKVGELQERLAVEEEDLEDRGRKAQDR